ncbi:MAG: FHA domain-containing protein [Kofleriaceae bacterium]
MAATGIGFRIFLEDAPIRALRFQTSVVKVGTIPSSHVRLDHPSVSRLHCLIETGPQPVMFDLGSASGTRVNGMPIQKVPLAAGDRIQIGVFTLVVVTGDELAGPGWDAPGEPVQAPASSTPLPGVNDARPTPRGGLAPGAFLASLVEQPITFAAPIGLPSDDAGSRLAGELPPQLRYLEQLPSPQPAAALVYVPEVATPGHLTAGELPAVLAALLDRSSLGASLAELAPAEHDLAEYQQMLTGLIVAAIDKLREHRDRPELAELYAECIRALGMFHVPRAAPSLLLELAHGIPKPSKELDWRANVCISIVRHPACWPYLMQVAELPGFATVAALAASAGGCERLPWLSHPFWRVRLAAASTISDDTERLRALAAVWASFGELPIDADPTEGHDLDVPAGEAWRTYDWRRAVERRGLEMLELPPLAPLVAGLEATCADHRAWTIRAVDRRCDPRDLVALAIADEIERPRVLAGWPAVSVNWYAWRRVFPELPLEAPARRRWLFAHALRQGELAGSAIAYLAGHVPTPPEAPRLVLDADAREAILDNERCELLHALVYVEDMSRRLEAEKAARRDTPFVPDSE